MRAERLPDLVNHSYNSQRHSTEASVSVTFDVSDIPDATDRDWTVSRRLKVAKGGSYTSTYLEGNGCELGKYGYNRDKKKGKTQIVFGLLCSASFLN